MLLFGAVELIKNTNFEKYKYSRYGIGFDRPGTFSFSIGGLGCNVIIFRVDMSSSILVNNKKKYILILFEGLTEGLDDAIFTTEKKSIQLILLWLERKLV